MDWRLATVVFWLIAGAALVARGQEAGPHPPVADEVVALPQDDAVSLTDEVNPAIKLWVGIETLGWGISGQSLPALVTGSPAGTRRDEAGVLGAPGTRILYGDDTIGGGMQAGLRVYSGIFLNQAKTWAVDGSFYTLYGGDTAYLSPDGPIVSRPFRDPGTGEANAALVTYPGVMEGNVSVETCQLFYGLDVNFRRNLFSSEASRIDLIAGYRNMGFNEGLGVYEFITRPDGSIGYYIGDAFNTTNFFNGGQLGLGLTHRQGRWMVDAKVLLGLGGTSSQVQIDGGTTYLYGGGAYYTKPGGMLAQRTNMGEYEKQTLSFVPEVGLRLGYQVTRHITVTAGYTFIYWTGVARPGSQIDSTLSLDPDKSLGRPSLPGVQTSDIWIQGVSAGLELRF
ncbi:MAG: BBP7 family outer membrane beta-barrel protein [Gemmataceae bacterium]